MTDYIDRQAAIAYAISGRIRTLPTSEDGENWIRTAEVRQSLLDVPSAEVEPVKRGQWIQNDNGTYSCSLCQSWIPKEQHYYAQFCLYCGAKMDLEGEDHEQD